MLWLLDNCECMSNQSDKIKVHYSIDWILEIEGKFLLI